MRGALAQVTCDLLATGIIPAYAGSTSGRPSTPRGAGDHPRVCGEHCRTFSCIHHSKGSSPRMRGALVGKAELALARGIIPAYAGSTDGIDRRTLRVGDHPRVCGEHRYTVNQFDKKAGSSPRMRGAQPVVPVFLMLVRIIPAYAGSTWLPWQLADCSRDHPRVCGEHLQQRQGGLVRSGSSPRMRGARLAKV